MFSEFIEFSSFIKEVEHWTNCVALCCVVSIKLKKRMFATLTHK